MCCNTPPQAADHPTRLPAGGPPGWRHGRLTLRCCFRERRHFRGGFSLVEMMVVLVLIGLLAGLVTVNVRHYLSKGRQKVVEADMRSIEMALDTYYASEGRYPANSEGLEALRRAADGGEPLLKDDPRDPWGNRYQYISPGRDGEPYEVLCYGADGREGGTGEAADISTANLEQNR